jgi:hypothetical protein
VKRSRLRRNEPGLFIFDCGEKELDGGQLLRPQSQASVVFLQNVHAVVLPADLAAQRQVLLLDEDAEQRSDYDKNERTSEAEEHGSRRKIVAAI